MKKNEYLDYWNNIYSKKNYFGTGPTKLAKLAESLMKDYKIQSILEVGCGQGRDALYFSQLDYKVYAIDISTKAIDFIKKNKESLNIKNLTTVVHDIEEPLDYPTEFFDFVYSNLALQFFGSDSLKRIFNNISQVMKKNTLFLFSTKKEGDKYYNFGSKINEFAFEYKGVIRYFYPQKMLKDLLSQNFDILSLDSDNHINLDSSVSVWWKVIARKKSFFSL